MNATTLHAKAEGLVALHTPGPWSVKVECGDVVITSAQRPYIAEATKGGCRDEMEANARLIAAAPDLLAALQGLLSIIGESRGVAGYHLNGNIADWEEFADVGAAEAAVAKALGTESQEG